MPADSSSKTVLSCPRCGAGVTSGAARCWLCGAEVTHTPSGAEDALGPVAATARTIESARGFSLASLLLLMTLAALLLGIFRVAQGLGTLLLVAAVPALWHTVAQLQRRKQYGRSATIGEKALVFIVSLGVVAAAGLAAVVAFFSVCWAGYMAGVSADRGPNLSDVLETGELVGLFAGMSLGAILGVYLFVRIVRQFW